MKRKFIPLFLLPVLALTACGNIDARPNDYSDPLVVDKDKVALDVANNIKDIIYDAKLEGGAVATQVLDEILLTISKSVFGEFKEIKKLADENKTADLDAFIAAHKVYQGTKYESDTDKANARTRLINTVERIENNVAKKLFKEINGSYTRNGYFYEEDYLMSLRNSLKDVANPADEAVKAKLHNKVLILPDFNEEEDLFKSKEEGGLLTYAFYEDEASNFNYISKKVVPEIYREMLVEQYLFDSTNYASIGRAYARKVNIITINNRTDYPLLADALMDSYIDTYINANPADIPASHDFDIVETAWRGIGLEGVTGKKDGNVKEQAVYLLNQAGSTVKTTAKNEFTGSTYTYFPGTSYGEMAEDLAKVVKNPNKTDSTIENEFTNNGEYTVKQGVEVKENKIKQEDYTTDGWHIRNGGLTSLNETIRTRLFNIGVATALDDESYPDRFNEQGKYVLDEKNENSYVAKVNGRYFLKPVTSERVDNDDFENIDNRLKDMLWIDQASGSFTIVEITEAVSSSKLALEGKDNYENLYSFDKMDTVAHSVAEIIAENDSYRTLSTKYWLEKADIDYHDDTIYEYFTENFPELFEDK